MAEINDTFRVPTPEGTLFSDNDRLDFHVANSERLSDLKEARELVNSVSIAPQPHLETIPGLETVQLTPLEVGEWLVCMRQEYSERNWNLEEVA